MRFTAKRRRIIASGFFIVCLSAQWLFSKTTIVTYQEDSTTNFNNPERGMRGDGSGQTVGRIYYELGSYKNTDALPQSVFDLVDRDCNNYRSAGRKLIPRFRYYSQSGSDAPLERILKHIEQLGPVLKKNADVIALFEAGFIGCWGEWHHFGSSDVNNLDNTPARKAILFKELECWPQDRFVIIRYNNFKRQIFGTDIPLGPDSAFCGSYRARSGAMNDCFRYNVDDRGTYNQPPYTESIEFQKTFLNLDNRYVPQEGESCGSSSYSVCDSAIKDLKRMHWDVLAIGSFTSQWSSGGCLNKILRNFGYRLVLRTARFPDCVRPGYNYDGFINLQNVGWGKIYNARGCELVFRNTATKSKTIVKLTNDPRHWCMREDTLVNVPISAPIPATMPEGTYQVYLNLPDPYPSLHNRKEYSIRLANNNVWEDSTGYNSLQCVVSVTKNCAISTVKTDVTVSAGLESVSVKKLIGAVEISYYAGLSAPCTFAVFTLAGTRVWSRTVGAGMAGAGRVTWAGGAPGVYLLKVVFGDERSAENVPIHTRLFSIQ
jgi:hypothetical protein